MTMYEVHTPLPERPVGDAPPWPQSSAAIRRDRLADARTDPRTLSLTGQDRIPARVEYIDATHARVSHPLGVDHENVTLTVRRLVLRGLTVTLKAA